MENTCRQSRFHISLFKNLREVLLLFGSPGGNVRDGYIVPDVIYKFNSKTAIGAISKVNISTGNLNPY